MSEIEKAARAAGLLGDRQDISHAKRFKRAKANLGVQSVREGFGRDGVWAWALPPPAKVPAPERTGHLSAVPQVPAIQTEPELAVTYDDTIAGAELGSPKVSLGNDAQIGLPPEFRDFVGVPRSWLAGVARLQGHRQPRDVPPRRRRQLVLDCYRFIVSPEGWAQRAFQLGWDEFSLFGCHRTNTLAYLGFAGLSWFINGGHIIRIHDTWAQIQSANEGSRTRHRRRIDPALVTLPWLLR